ncbi:MFS transporter [Marinithermofilum abyssi]|uniref:MFS transporter n=2 Tax=Marinithermofilum abyssi TaxID=1571185 RepID=A0A8J2VIS2_9BACL|nr:MFS transporter [Marinithermofilum abyssi]
MNRDEKTDGGMVQFQYNKSINMSYEMERMDVSSEKSNEKAVITGLLLGILMASMDNTIVATAMGTIVSELGDFDQFVWVTSAYMIASVAGMPIFGKLSDMYGRKIFYILGLTLFLVGSVLCGTAQSMLQLSLYRAMQGLGGGALMPIAFTIIFDIFPAERRGKMSGLFGAVFGISSVFGPLLGAFITDAIDWRWIFYINVPLGVLSLWFIYHNYHEALEHERQQIDWWGAGLLVVSIVSLMFALELGGKQYAWDSPQVVGLFTVFAVFLAVLLWVEKRVPEPIISLNLFKRRLFAASQGIGFFYGAVFIAATMFIPIFVQAVYGGTATHSGMILTPMMLGSVAGSQIGGRFVMKTSYRNMMIGSGLLFLLGILLLGTLSSDTPRWLVTIYMVITGVGVGISFPILSMSSIHNLKMYQRGTANSSIAFFRAIGMTLGITVFGAIQNHIMLQKIREALPNFHPFLSGRELQPQALFQPEVREQIPPQVLQSLTKAFADSIAQVFQWSLIAVGIALVLIFLMSDDRLETTDSAAASSLK